MRSLSNQRQHDTMVPALFQDLLAKGYEKVASDQGAEFTVARPEKLYSERAEMFFCPDVCAEKDGNTVYFEVETEDSIGSAITRAEIECFLAHAQKNRGYFYLVVPQPVKEKAASLLREFDHKDNHRAFVLTL